MDEANSANDLNDSSPGRIFGACAELRLLIFMSIDAWVSTLLLLISVQEPNAVPLQSMLFEQ